MNEEKKSVSRFAVMAKGARNVGLWLLGLGVYLGVLLLIVVVLCKGVALGRLNVAEAVAFATFGTTFLHWMVLGASV